MRHAGETLEELKNDPHTTPYTFQTALRINKPNLGPHPLLRQEIPSLVRRPDRTNTYLQLAEHLERQQISSNISNFALAEPQSSEWAVAVIEKSWES